MVISINNLNWIDDGASCIQAETNIILDKFDAYEERNRFISNQHKWSSDGKNKAILNHYENRNSETSNLVFSENIKPQKYDAIPSTKTKINITSRYKKHQTQTQISISMITRNK